MPEPRNLVVLDVPTRLLFRAGRDLDAQKYPEAARKIHEALEWRQRVERERREDRRAA